MAGEYDQQKDLKAHEGTYGAFVGMVKWGVIVCAILVMIVIWLIT
jgi:hypothetical protein